jgi:multiple RNA-binding domain-containing protein 1
MLDKHKVQLQLARQKASNSTAGKNKAKEKEKGTKVVVRNVAFEATRKDLMGLFGPFGHIKSCRLPKKFDGSHRGFAFVEFVTKQEAENAMDGVGGIHLYGRRLVVEYAAQGEEEGLTELRAKTAQQVRGADEESLEGQTAAKRLKQTL